MASKKSNLKPGDRVTRPRRSVEAPSRFKDMIITTPSTKVPKIEVETHEVRLPNGNPELPQTQTNGKQQKKVNKPVVNARETLKAHRCIELPSRFKDMIVSPPPPKILKTDIEAHGKDCRSATEVPGYKKVLTCPPLKPVKLSSQEVRRSIEASTRYKDTEVVPPFKSVKVSKNDAESQGVHHGLPNGKNKKLEQVAINGKHHKRGTKPVVKAREIVKMQTNSVPTTATTVPKHTVPRIVEDKSFTVNDASSVNQKDEEEFDKLSDDELKKRLEKLSWEDERIDILLKLIDSASSKRNRCEISAELLSKLGSPGFIDAEFLKAHPETVKIVRKMAHFVGNPVGWRMTKVLKEQLEVKTEKIRKTAEATFEHFKSLFQTNTKPLAVQFMEMHRLNSGS